MARFLRLSLALGTPLVMASALGLIAGSRPSILQPASASHDISSTGPFPSVDVREDLPGGETTVADTSPTALGRAAKNLAAHRWLDVLDGKRVFQRVWIAGNTGNDGTGLGPLFNGASCNECHFRDGRGGRPTEQVPDVRLLARLGSADASQPEPDPHYGNQLNDQAAKGMRREGLLGVDYELIVRRLADGKNAELRRPSYSLEALSKGHSSRPIVLSPRMPGALVGMGLLEAIPATSILERVDAEDRDGDGISGRANWVPSEGSGERTLGRFGWKASQPSVLRQIATAFREDMGLTSWMHPGNACDAAEPNCVAHDRPEEVSARELEQVTNYVKLLGVPARRDAACPDVRTGRQLFFASGCAACHTPKHVTASKVAFDELENQTIFPYTDLLLHDMGHELADEVREFEAEGREWRTPPLWGIGLLKTIHGRLRLLHDGRARSIEEAILWHGGEATGARDSYAALTQDERSKLVRFIGSL